VKKRSSTETRRLWNWSLLIIIVPFLFGGIIFSLYLESVFSVRSTMMGNLRNHAKLQHSLLAETIEQKLNSLAGLMVIVQQYEEHIAEEQETENEPEEARRSLENAAQRIVLTETSISQAYILSASGDQLDAFPVRSHLPASVTDELVHKHTSQLLPLSFISDTESRRFYIGASIQFPEFTDNASMQMLVFTIEADTFLAAVAHLETLEMNGALICDSSGNPAASWTKSFGPETGKGTGADISSMLKHVQQTMTEKDDPSSLSDVFTAYEDDTCLLITKKLPSYSLFLSTHYSKTAYMAAWNRSFRRTVILMSILLLMTLIFGFLLSRHIAKEYAERKQLLKELEETVSERTRELRDKSEKLEAENRAHKETAAALQKSEEQYRQAQKLESIGQLAGGVAHDFNNMLSVILGYAEIALEQADASEELHGYLGEIQKAAQKSAQLTRQLLAFARKQTIAPRLVLMNEQIHHLMPMIRSLISDEIELHWHPGSDLHQILIDPSQLDQVIINLLLNARDAVRGTGNITIETDNIFIDESYSADHLDSRPGPYAMLIISDDGCGMDKTTMERIFDPFFTTKKQGEGTGLGLSMVYGVIRQNRGFINVYSEPDSGTVVKLYFPAAEKLDSAAEIPDSDAAVKPGKTEPKEHTILFVEDDPALLELNTAILKRLGYSVISTSSAAEALQLAEGRTNPVDLLITDVVMPQMNGKKLAEKMQKIYPDMQCLYVSGYTANVIAHHGILDDDINFIQKPFSIEKLSAVLEDILKD